MTNTRIDVHAHFVPEHYRHALAAAGHDHPDGIKAIPEWSPELALAAMDRLGVATSLLSISSPGVHFGDDAKAAELARLVNEDAMRLREQHPERFGFFASVPLPDVDASLSEMRFALDDLGADGITIETNHHGMYLGDERLEPIFAEASARETVIFIHPTSPHGAGELALGYPRPMLEFMFDTTRSVTNLVLSGMLQRHPGARVIVPHAGAALPVLANRIELLLPLLTPAGGATPPSIRSALARLHFDLAGAPVDELLTALLSVADPTRIHYGSDYPFTPADAAVGLAERLESTTSIDDDMRQSFFVDNALALFPRLGVLA
ncbi:amidohydrolase family protein [Lacisediminihabitans profunda]|uniref:6-methylsalicylate decarboxylase n=1 Tax=Lacisediminihabitans profunda TaxID=2594790 RepID=A0A5C8UQ19_9MICO|nr:amidohydrolase family protein [Lacisediminihabitans profunda]TXN29464.1 amidohydrolase [Lacisediminihabitans profunda]